MKALALWIALALAVIQTLTPVSAAEAGDPSRTYAILVSGGNKPASNHIRYWGDMALAYGMLRRDCKVPRQNVRLLWGSGDPSKDLCVAGRKCSQCHGASLPLNPADFDRDGVGDIDGAATFANVEAAFAEFRARLTAGDQLFVFFTDHGKKSGVDALVDFALEPFASLKLWDGELLSDWMLASWTRDIPCPVILAVECCYGGAILADAIRSPGVRFATTASEYNASAAGDTQPWFDQWAYQFISAFRGYYPKSGLNPQDKGAKCKADADGDGVVSVREAARFAYRNRCGSDYPQYAESWSGCGSRLLPKATMTAEELNAYAMAHADERRGFLGFRRAWGLTLKGGASSAEKDGTDEFALERMSLHAPAGKTDKNGNRLDFQRWTVAPATADLGPEFDLSSADTHFLMPAKALTLTPAYVNSRTACSVTLQAGPNRSGKDFTDAFQWSPDGKAWYRNGVKAVLAPGTYSLRWRSLSEAWKAPTAKTKVTLKKGESYDNASAPATFSYVPAVRVSSTSGGKVKSSPSAARIASGKKITLTATASKGHVFAGWGRADAEIPDPKASRYSFAMPSDDVEVTARFVTKEHDAASVALTMGGIRLKAGSSHALSTNVMCGVEVVWPLVRSADSSTTVKASGLPSGLSLRHDKKTDDYVISGVPSSASKKSKSTGKVTPSKAKITVTTAGKNSKSYWVEITVKSLPAWAYGTFSGYAAQNASAAGVGVATLTVAASGKLSGKFSVSGTNWTCSASGYTSFADDQVQTNRIFRFDGTAKAGKKSQAVLLEVTSGWLTDGSTSRLNCSFADGLLKRGLIELRREVWKDGQVGVKPKAVKSLSLSDQGYPKVLAKVAATGKVTYAGKLNDGRKISTSSTAFIDPDEMIRAWMILPYDRKQPGYLDLLNIEDIDKKEKKK